MSKDFNKHFSAEEKQMSQKLSITYHYGSANQIYNEIPSHTNQDDRKDNFRNP
jgi:hypothetical protein